MLLIKSLEGGEFMFPEKFLFGASMSGFQFEMGETKESIDGKTDWFAWVRDLGNIINGVVSGDLPENGPGYWDKFDTVHNLAKEFGMNAMRIGIEWSRIFPNTTKDVVVNVIREDDKILEVNVNKQALRILDEIANKKAVERYREILSDLRKKGFKVIIDLNHFTLPVWIHDPISIRDRKETEALGWINPDTVVEFAKYASYVAWKFSDLVDLWITLNEPQIVSSLGYIFFRSGFPPAVFSPSWYVKSLYNQIQAHARAYDAIRKFCGKSIGVIYSFTWVDSPEEDQKIIENAMYFNNWYFMDGLVFGKVLNEERPDLKRLDFIGVNYYTRTVASSSNIPLDLDGWKVYFKTLPGYGYICEPYSLSNDGRPTSEFGWEIYPEGLLKILLALKERYNLPMIITENGIADSKDILRPYFLVSHLKAVEEAIEKNVDVFGYLHWSIIDNYEWAQGFKMRFGLAEVDYSTKTYHPRPSMYVFKEIIKKRTTSDFSRYLRSPYTIWKD